MRSTALVSIDVGVVVERRTAKSAWAEFLWSPVSVLIGQPLAEPWTVLNESGDVTLFYAGSAVLELHRTETGSYRDSLAAPVPSYGWPCVQRRRAPPTSF